MSRYCLTRAASVDLDNIWDHTVTRWGTTRAEAYLEEVFACFARAAAAPGTGQDRAAFVARARSLPAGRHLVFYRATDGGVVILRIVHERRNLAALRFGDEGG